MRRIIATGLLALMAIVAGCSGSKQSEPSSQTNTPSSNTAAPQTHNVNVATATTGGAYYPIGNAIAQLWSEKAAGVKASAQATNGTPHNIQLMGKNEAEVGFAQSGVVYQAVNGVESFKDQGKQTHIKGMTYLYPNVMQWVVRKDSGIKSLADLKGKRFVPGPTNSATEINSREMLAISSLDYRERKDLSVDYMDYSQAAEKLKNRQTDAIMIAGGLPTAAVLDVMTAGDGQLLSLPDDYIKALVAKYPWYFPITIPKGTYKGQEADVKTVAVANVLVVRADLPDDLVYNLVKSMYDNADRLGQAHQAMKAFKKEEGLNGMTGVIELHPGAAKYFKEVGILR